MTRNGKVARLPRECREALNRRLQDGEPGTKLVVWLNELPEVRTVLAHEFGRRPISVQNLSEWKAGGYRDWLARQEALDQAKELTADAQELRALTGGRMADHLATVLEARYAGLLAAWSGTLTAEFKGNVRALRSLCQDIVELRRGDHSEERLGLEREHLRQEQEKTADELFEHFMGWARNPHVRDLVMGSQKDPKDSERRMREIFGLASESGLHKPMAVPEAPPSPK